MIELIEVKKIIKESIVLVIIASITAFTVNLFHPKGYLLISREALNLKKIVNISSEEAKIKKDNNAAVIIDSRNTQEYRDEHIEGAISIPASPESISLQKIKRNLDLIQKPMELIIYCTGTSCNTSYILAKRFIMMGYKRHIYIIEHGLPEWIDSGYQIEKFDTVNQD